MPSMLAQAVAGMSAALQGVAGVEITYHAGARSLAITAVVGRSVWSIEGEPIANRLETRDYLIAADDLAVDGWRWTPARGDRIEETDGTTTTVYEVLAPAGEPCYRPSDPQGVILRVHTQKVATR